VTRNWEPTPRLKPIQRKALLDALNSPTGRKANGAAQAIIQSPDPALLPGIVRILLHGKRLHNRIEAAYAMRGMRGTNGRDGAATLEKILANRKEKAYLRAFVAETLADRHRPTSHDVVLRNLADPSAQVRFWCAFALGQMRDRNALPLLASIAENDHRIVRGWWAVSKEARDAIRLIKNGRGIRWCARCPRTKQ
jgi:HEAT repeat protein